VKSWVGKNKNIFRAGARIDRSLKKGKKLLFVMARNGFYKCRGRRAGSVSHRAGWRGGKRRSEEKRTGTRWGKARGGKLQRKIENSDKRED